ncbi:ABC transporter permease [Brevibacillus sp. NRS-1366]|uniref:ABC transporter permease n=1 Tax=Brevibacillus sp. NRS-1366 TaxID=3233899 RepID=UPI003D1D779D
MKLSKEKKSGILGLALVFPSFLLLLGVVIVPIFFSTKESLLNEQGGYDFSHYTALFSDEVMRLNIWYTLKVTIISTVLVLAISYGVALLLRFSNGTAATWIRRLYLIPMFVPGVIATYAIISMYGNHGWLARFFTLFGIESFPKIIFDLKGLILANLWFNIPFSTMLLASALGGIPNSIIESAKDAGAGKWQLFFRFILPLSYKTMLVAVTFVFMGVIGSFTAPYLIGPNAPQVLGVAMHQVFSVYQETAQASALAVFMFLLCSAMGYFYIRTMTKDAKDEATRAGH